MILKTQSGSHFWIVAVLAMALVLLTSVAACGSDPTATPAPTATAVPPAATPTPVPPGVTPPPATATPRPAAKPAANPTATPVPVTFEGRTVRLVIPFNPGGGSDVYGRLVARNLGKFLPGNPRIAAANMPGAGGVVAANYIGNVAKNDGLTLGQLPGGVALNQLQQDEGVSFNVADFNWLVNANTPTNMMVVRADRYDSFEAIRNSSSPVKFATETPTFSAALLLTHIKRTLDIPMNVISGYSGFANWTQAVERGEVDGTTGFYDNFLNLKGDHFKSGDWIFVLQTGIQKDARIPEVPWIYDLITEDADVQILNLLAVPSALTRLFTLPPGTPANIVAAYKESFETMLVDPGFLADATKIGVTANWLDGDAVATKLQEIIDTPDDVVARLKDLSKP